ncbi:hypothetical protein [Aeoliella sp.]|uniref:hypothetical protein n=1 Tax=Aeoliella sp. TaxID=2795800 RepID=UPI003CCBF329
MSTVPQSSLYDELLDLFANSANKQQLLTFRLPAEKQERLDLLLAKNREGSLTVDEQFELEEFERLVHLGRMLKARAKRTESR